MKVIDEKTINTQESLDDLTLQLFRLDCKYDIKFKEIAERLTKQDGRMAKFDEQMAEQDERIATCVKDIDDIKNKPYASDNSSGKSN